MTNDNQPETILPIHEATARQIYNDIFHHAVALQTAIMRAADHAEVIGLPQPDQAPALRQKAIDLIWALSEATHNIQHHHNRRKAATTAQPASSAQSRHQQPHHTKPHLRIGTPATEKPEDPDHS